MTSNETALLFSFYYIFTFYFHRSKHVFGCSLSQFLQFCCDYLHTYNKTVMAERTPVTLGSGWHKIIFQIEIPILYSELRMELQFPMREKKAKKNHRPVCGLCRENIAEIKFLMVPPWYANGYWQNRLLPREMFEMEADLRPFWRKVSEAGQRAILFSGWPMNADWGHICIYYLLYYIIGTTLYFLCY
jgi:hypothetical protein